MTTPADIFLEVLKDARKKQGIDLKTLSEKTGIPEHSLRRWEAKGQRPRIQSAFRVAQELGFRIELTQARK